MSDTLKIAIRVAASRPFAVSDDIMIGCLTSYLLMKYEADLAYRSYADRVRGPWRDALYGHWKEHSEDERKGSYDIAMKLVALGVDPQVGELKVPEVVADTSLMMQALTAHEERLIDQGIRIIGICGEDVGLRILMENLVVNDSHHLDDLRRMNQRSDF